jgi:hypothetical protein
LLKNGHLLRFPHPSSLRRTAKYASLLRISGALHLTIFEQPGKDDFFNSLLDLKERNVYGRDEISAECETPNYFLLTAKRNGSVEPIHF